MNNLLKLPILIIFFCSFQLLATPLSPNLLTEEGDSYYIHKQYNLAHLYYSELFKKQPNPMTGSRLLLVSLRQNDTKTTEKLMMYQFQPDFTFDYLSLYSSLVLNRSVMTDLISNRLQKTSQLINKQSQFEYLMGAQLINSQEFKAAKTLYSKLSLENNEIGQQSHQILNDLEQIESLPSKSPWAAALFSTVIPGAGQIYSRQYSDGIMAFFWTASFLGGAIYTNRLETMSNMPHYGSSLFGFFGLMFYASNIVGGYSSAHRYNTFYQRKFVERLRKIHFSIDIIEEFSGIEFSRPIR